MNVNDDPLLITDDELGQAGSTAQQRMTEAVKRSDAQQRPVRVSWNSERSDALISMCNSWEALAWRTTTFYGPRRTWIVQLVPPDQL